jgi:predicted transcriptional regulator
MTSDDSHTPLAVLAESAHRREILTLLRDSETPLTNATLTERSSGERQTVHATIQQLGDNGWVRKTAKRHNELTVTGHLVLRVYERFCKQESESTFLFLTRSPTRSHILRYLSKHTQAQNRDQDQDQNHNQDQQNEYCRFVDIAERLTGSRPTVSQRLHDCTERGWLSKGTGAQYVITSAGNRVIRAYDTLGDTISWVTTNAACLNRFDSEHIDIGAGLPLAPLRNDVTAIKAGRADPDTPFLHYREQLTTTQPATLHGILPVASLQAAITRGVLADANTDIELIMDDAAIEAARTSYPTQFATVCADERITLLKHPSLLEIGLSLFDGTAVLGAYSDEDGHLHATLSSSAEPFTEYATHVYDEHCHRSIPLD